MLNIYALRTEYRERPVGIDRPQPRFSWKLSSDGSGVMQKTYRLQVRKDQQAVWDSGVVESDQSQAIRYAGTALEPETLYTVSCAVTDGQGNAAEAESTFRTGLMDPARWQAEWITHPYEEDLEAAAVFCRTLPGGKDIASAFLYVSALGLYEAEINGAPVSDVQFAPGWTSYQARIQYQTYDVTGMLREAERNELRITVGDGWYKGVLGFYGQGNHYGTLTGLIAQIHLIYGDGTEAVLGTDDSWTVTTGPVRANSIYHGTVIDRTFGSPEALPAVILEQSKDVLTAQQDEPVRITERVPAARVFRTPKGEVVLDFGQNLNGVIEAKFTCPRGTRVVLRHAEALDENGNMYYANLRTARATDTFITSGGEDVFFPYFTYHGFRYAAVEGLPGEPDPANFTACVLGTDLERAGSFTCSNELVQRLWWNIDWTMRSNFLELPTDCPQRDERFGYTGDAQLFFETAVSHRNAALFFEKWLQDLKYEQQVGGGGVPTAVPNILGPSGGIAIWHDAATVVSWGLWQTYGDPAFLEEQFDSMVACVEYTKNMTGADGLIHTGQQLGDWVAMDAERGPLGKYRADVLNLSPGEKTGATDVFYIANVYYLNSIHIVAQSAEILGRAEEAERYGALYERVLQAVRDEYITKTGHLVSETQTGCALALHFGVAEEKDQPRILQGLRDCLARHDNHLTTGFVGTPILCRVLSENGMHDVAGKVFLKEDCPSWLYSVKLGATTVWELWDGVNADGSFNKYEMNSLNQYTFASIGDWIFHDLCGLQRVEPGYKRSRIRPRLILDIPEVSGVKETVYGTLSCRLSCADGQYTADITIPANTTAEVDLPGREIEELGSGTYHFVWETEDSFLKLPYNMDTLFSEILANPAGKALLEQYAPELMANEMFLAFGAGQPMETIYAMLPAEARPLFDMAMKVCNDSVKA